MCAEQRENLYASMFSDEMIRMVGCIVMFMEKIYGHKSGFRVFILFFAFSLFVNGITKGFAGCSPHLGRNSLNQVQCLGIDKFKG